MMQKSVRLDAITIKNSISPYDFYLREQGLSHYGAHAKAWVEAGLCPCHDDKSPGSFFINLENGAFKCFSCGAKGGDIISFVMQKYNLSFRESLELLYNRGGLR